MERIAIYIQEEEEEEAQGMYRISPMYIGNKVSHLYRKKKEA